MSHSRRHFLSTAALAAIPPATFAERPSEHGLAHRITSEFSRLPGTKGLKIWAPPVRGGREFLAEIKPDTALFCASSFKGFVLAEFLRRMEDGDTSLSELLTVDDSVWSLGAPVLTHLPGAMRGQYEALATLEAMISRSDNTATDMTLKRVGVERVRSFIASIGLTNTHIPNSTRQFFAYMFGVPNWPTIGWADLIALAQANPSVIDRMINGVQTMAVSPHDFVSFYSRALQGKFFRKPEALQTFRSVLALADAIPLTMPLGVNAFMKGGSIDVGNEHALSIAGGMFIPPGRWAYYSLIINWLDGQGGTVADETAPFTNACKCIFTMLRDALSHAGRDA